MPLTDQEITPCTLVAAIDSNHNGKEEMARRLIDAAVASGCSAVKFQRHAPVKEASEWASGKADRNFPEASSEITATDVQQDLELSPESFRKVREYARGRIMFIGAPFDQASLEFLDPLDIDFLKVEPPHALNLPLLEMLSHRKKKVLISLSFCTEEDIKAILDLFRGGDLVLVHEISMRPVRTEISCLGYFAELQKYHLPLGYADKGEEFLPAIAARILGATVIEKSFTLCRELVGAGHASSLEPDEMRRFVKGIRHLEHALSSEGPRKIPPGELERYDEEGLGLAAKRNIRAGETITEEMISIISPPVGLTPRIMKEILGKKVLYDIKRNDPITFGLIDL